MDIVKTQVHAMKFTIYQDPDSIGKNQLREATNQISSVVT